MLNCGKRGKLNMGAAAYNRGTRAISEQISQELRERRQIHTEHTEKALADIGTASTARVIRRMEEHLRDVMTERDIYKDGLDRISAGEFASDVTPYDRILSLRQVAREALGKGIAFFFHKEIERKRRIDY